MNSFEKACFGDGPIDLRPSVWRKVTKLISSRRAKSPGMFECGVLRLPGLETYALMRVRDREALLLRQGYISQEDANDLWAKHLERINANRV
jgi:hypothetical protein